MKEQIGFCQFCDRFRDMDRKDQFSYYGKKALYEWLEESEEESGIEYELDVIALCCEFVEYDSLEDFQKEYSKEYKTIDELEEDTFVIPLENSEGFVIQCF